MANRWGKSGTLPDFQEVSKINVYPDCRHEIKRQLLFGRNAMTNLDSNKKSETLLLTKVCIVKAMVFPVVRYGHES